MNAVLQLHEDLDHARWRVRFVRRLLDVHQNCVDTHNQKWWLEEADLLQQLAAAEDDLAIQTQAIRELPTLAQASLHAIRHSCGR
jgi:hypothetical protein